MLPGAKENFVKLCCTDEDQILCTEVLFNYVIIHLFP